MKAQTKRLLTLSLAVFIAVSLQARGAEASKMCGRDAISDEKYLQIRDVICADTWRVVQKETKQFRGAIGKDMEQTAEGIQGRVFLNLLNKLEAGQVVNPTDLRDVLDAEESKILRLGLRAGAVKATFEPKNIQVWCSTKLRVLETLPLSNPSPVVTIENAVRCVNN
ncbi:MAG: hypothetical protein AAFO73_11395 [Pseudomonadota bacterium]